MKRARVAQIVTGDDEVAGVQRHVAWLAESSRHDHCLLVSKAPAYEAYLLARGVSYQRFSNLREGLSILRRMRPEVVHAHLGQALILGALHKRLVKNVPFLYTQHILHPRSASSKGLGALARTFVLKKAYRSLDVLIAVSHAVARETQRRQEHDNVRVVWNGVGIPWRDSPRPPSEVSENPLRVLGLARMEPEKRPGDFIDVAKRLDDPRIVITVYGAGSLLEHMRERERKELAACATRVDFAGYEPAIEEQISRAHVLLHFGREEACPLSLIEVQRQGLPVVTYGLGGNVELVPPGNGVLVGEGDFDAAANALRLYQADRNALSKASEACRQFSKDLSLEENARRTDAVYEELLSRYFPPGQDATRAVRLRAEPDGTLAP